MSNPYDIFNLDDRKRLAVMGAFARAAKKSDLEDNRLESVAEDTSSEHSNLVWRPQGQKSQDEESLAYTKEYIAEYHGEDEELDPSEQTNQPGDNLNQPRPQPVDEIIPVVERIEINDVKPVAGKAKVEDLPPLPTIRGRPARIKEPGESSSSSVVESTRSVNEFELTSTILPVSVDKSQDEYTSNVSVQDIRRDFFRNYSTNTTVPIYRNRSNIINSINSYSVVIIQGQTGCGKTTQVPSYILEDAILDKNQDKAPVIYVTQPRRIAARSIADRVCEEHGWEMGTLVGYQVGLEKRVGPQTILTYCTSGVLLQKLIQEKSLKNYTHIIIDEAHERDADTDLLMMMIRTLMRKEMSFFRLIVMSATIDVSKLKAYFTFKTSYGHNSQTTPSVCRVGTGKTPADVQMVYFDKLKSTFQIDETVPCFERSDPEVHDECMNAAVKIIVDLIPRLDTFGEDTQTTLVFLPGLAEITKLHKMLLARRALLDIIPLHSCLSAKDQLRVFLPSEAGYRKVILATNIAESSITVRDAGFIVDFCLTKCLKKDEVTRFPTLKLEWCSKDKCVQRAGRTGRCCPGKVFRMISHNFYRTLPEFSEPELLVAPLELSVLRVKNFNMGDVKALLAVVLDPPPIQEIRTAVLELKQIGALTSKYRGELTDIDGDLTELGRVISTLPIDVHLSKLIVVAYLLDVLEDAIIVAACLSTNRTVVKHLYGRMLESYEQKLEWSKGSASDLFISLDVYKDYIYHKEELGKNQNFMENYCNNYHLDERKLHEVSALVEELVNRLQGLNICIQDNPNRERNKYEDELMLKVAFCAAFYPNYFLTQELDHDEIRRDLWGFEPAKTVVIHNFPCNQVPLYRTQVLNQIREKVPANIEYIADNSRALLVIDDDQTMQNPDYAMIGIENVVQKTTRIPKSVYLALKYSESEFITIREFKEVHAQDRMKYYRDKRSQVVTNRLAPSLTKLVVGRPADNRGLLETPEDEYNTYFTNNYFVEVEFNEEQDKNDLSTLRILEQFEEKLRTSKPNNKPAPLDESLNIFKDIKTLKGPTSPIQLKFQSLLQKSKGYNVDIDPQSVNSILLDPDYHLARRQMLVAASVGQTHKHNRIIARDTTMMPNIRGLPTVMALLFAQYSRLVYNQHIKCFSGAVFGLGWDQNDKPLNKQFEVEFNFDVHITQDDLELINTARSMVSDLIKLIEIQDPGAHQSSLQEKLRLVIMTLIRKRRYPLSPTSMAEIDWTDGGFKIDKTNFKQFEPVRGGHVREFLPKIHTSTKVIENELFVAIRNDLNQLDEIDNHRRQLPIGGVSCLLCGSGLGQVFLTHSKLRNHLDGDAHIRNLIEFEKGEERARMRAEAEAEAEA